MLFIRIVGDLQRAQAGPFRETSPGVCLQAPGDAPEEELLVIRAARFPESFPVLLLELADGHVAEGFNLFMDGRRANCLFSHGVNLTSHDSLFVPGQSTGGGGWSW
jgi:hypothetical protein